MSGHDDARWFLDQLRVQTAAALGAGPADRADPGLVRSLRERLVRESLSAHDRNDPALIRALERTSEKLTGATADDSFTTLFTDMFGVIESTVAEQNPGLDLDRLRPLIGHLRTGHLNAVTMRVPGGSGAHLVLIEDQLPLFASKLSKAFAWALPGQQGRDGQHHFQLSRAGVTARLDADAAIGERFADIVLQYAVRGTLDQAGHHLLPQGWFNFANILRSGLEFFILGHEYAHVVMGHLDAAANHRGVLPAAEAEAVAWSWRQEMDADLVGAVLALNAMSKEEVAAGPAFMGISLFFDVTDVFDRAVSLLMTGSEESHQVGSHPPAAVRKRHVSRELGAGDQLRDAIGGAEVVGEVVELLWQRTRPALLAMHRRGVRPARMWHTIPREHG